MKKIRFSWFSCVIFHDGLLDQWVVFDSDVANPQSQSLESLSNQFHIPNQQSFALKECMKNPVFHMALSENRLLLLLLLLLFCCTSMPTCTSIIILLYKIGYCTWKSNDLHIPFWNGHWNLSINRHFTSEALKSGSSSTCWSTNNHIEFSRNPYLGWF